MLSLAGYGEALDSTYYKVWSDSSWETFYTDTTINGTAYAVLLNNSDNEYFYGPDGYSGFGQYGGSVVLFDSALASLPDSMLEGTPYTAQTTFSYQGTSYTLIDQETLLDTATVTVPFGTFTDCLVRQSVTAVNGVLQSVTLYWLAKGPSDIARQDYSGYTILMAYGVVNGQGWGVSLSRKMPGVPRIDRGMIIAPQKTPAHSVQSVEDIHSLAPMILKGIVR